MHSHLILSSLFTSNYVCSRACFWLVQPLVQRNTGVWLLALLNVVDLAALFAWVAKKIVLLTKSKERERESVANYQKYKEQNKLINIVYK